MGLWVAAAQMTSTEDVTKNLESASELIEGAAAAGAKFVGLPENFAYLGGDADHKRALAEDIGDGDEGTATGPILSAMRAAARKAQVWLLLGGFPERLAGGADRIGNTSILLDSTGAIRARYRKIHLFDAEVPSGHQFRESDVMEGGHDVVVSETPWGRLGLTICYDLRFPELYRSLINAGAVMISVPSAFTRETGKDHWHVLLRARAIENQAFVIAPAQYGLHGGKRASYGHALVVDPWGVVLAECGDREGFALAELDFDYQREVRRKLPCLSHRKL